MKAWRQHCGFESFLGLALLCFVMVLACVLVFLSGVTAVKVGAFVLDLIVRGLRWL